MYANSFGLREVCLWNSTRPLNRLLRGSAIAAVLPTLMVAQLTTGRITGIVTDSTGAVIVGAIVSARNIATGVVPQTTSSSTGNYLIPDLSIGTYSVEVTA